MPRSILGPNAHIPEKPARKTPVRSRAPKPLGDIAIVTVYLDRATGKVDVDDTFSTPLETRGMLGDAYDQLYAKLDDNQEESE